MNKLVESFITAPQEISTDVLIEKYAKGTETTEGEIFARVAKGLAKVEKKEDQARIEKLFLDNMNKGGIGAGRIMSSSGTDIQATLINCFVQPVGDCIQGVDDDGIPGIYEALREAAETMRRGGGVGYDFSRIRPKGAYVKGTHSIASGPCSYINVFDQSCSTVESAGSRRGAQMGVLRIDHPDIMDFVAAKRTVGRWNNFNVSVGMVDDFMKAVQEDSTWELVHKAKPNEALLAAGAHQRADGKWVYKTVRAQEVWNHIMQSTYDYAEPGILFLDNMNSDNSLKYCETIEATNPCGEQDLPPYGCCDLGPIILTKFIKNPFGFAGEPKFDFEGFAKVVRTQVRMLDNVLDATHWPLTQQEQESKNKRRIGVGFTGLGDALIMLKLRYNTEAARMTAAYIAKVMRDEAFSASVELAKERGSFLMFDADKYLAEGGFVSRLEDGLKDQIRLHGIRNSRLLSIAPTGTVSLAFADNASNGIEPAFSWTYNRKKREADGSSRTYAVEDHAYRLYRELGGDVDNLPDYFVTALEMSASDHLGMMKAVQPYIDAAISKTVNVPAEYPFEDFKNLYLEAWEGRLKGVATYRPNAILGSVLSVSTPETPKVEEASPVAGTTLAELTKSVVDHRPQGDLPAVASKIKYWTSEGPKTLYLVTSFLVVEGLVNGEVTTIERAVEFFQPVGQSGESQQWITSTMRMLSLAARGGFLERALADMRKVAWDKGAVRLGTRRKEDGTEIPLWHDSEVAAIAYAIEEILAKRKAPELVLGAITQAETTDTLNTAAAPTGLMAGKKCPDCGAHAVIKRDGCSFCTSCGTLGSCG